MLITTVISILVALIMSAVAWRARASERERSAARVEALARDIREPSPAVAPAVDELPLRSTGPRSGPRADDMFAVTTRPSRSASRWGLAFAVGAFTVASAAALVIVFSGDAPGTRIALASGAEGPTPPAAGSRGPLELTALGHTRDGGQLTVQGVVRNPATGTEMDRLSAVVVLFDRDGQILTTSRAPVASPALIPGGESPFTVVIPDTAEIARYRISFRSDERVVPHVDRRVAP